MCQRHPRTTHHVVRSRIGFGYDHPFLCRDDNGDIIPNPELIEHDWHNVLNIIFEPLDEDYTSNPNSLVSAINESHRNANAHLQNQVTLCQRNFIFFWIRQLVTAFHTGTTAPGAFREVRPRGFNRRSPEQQAQFIDQYARNLVLLQEQMNHSAEALLNMYNHHNGTRFTWENQSYKQFARTANDLRRFFCNPSCGICLSWPVKIGPPNRPRNDTKIFYTQYKMLENILYLPKPVRMTSLAWELNAEMFNHSIAGQYLDSFPGVQGFYERILAGDEEDAFMTYHEWNPTAAEEEEEDEDGDERE